MKRIIIFCTIICLLSSEVVVVHAQDITSLSQINEETPSVTQQPSVTPGEKGSGLLQEAQNKQERMSKIKQEADMYIQERITAINALIIQIDNAKYTSATTLQIIQGLREDIQGLQSLQAQIDTFNDPSQIQMTLFPLVKEIFTNYRIYAVTLPKAHALFYLSSLLYKTNAFAIIYLNMNNDIAYAQSQNIATITLQADAATFNADNTKLINNEQSVESQVNELMPQAYSSNEAPLKELKSKVASLHQEIANVEADYRQFTDDFKTASGLK